MASYEKRTWWTKHRLSDRLTDEGFLEAAVTAAFVIAAADGTASEREYDALLDRLELLGGIDRDKIDEKLTIASNELEATGVGGRLDRIAELVNDRDAAHAVLLLAVAIALADDEVTEDEHATALQLATRLGLDRAVLEESLALLGEVND